MAGPPKIGCFFVSNFPWPPQKVGVLMVIAPKRRKIAFFCLLIALALGVPLISAWADGASHTLTVFVQEIARYRIEEIARIDSDSNEALYQVRVAVFSNSQRGWELMAQAEDSEGVVEWSTDRRTWRKIAEGMNPVLSGSRANWEKYQLFYKIRRAENSVASPAIQVGYQLLYEN
jgi:hypothetical protein